MKLAIPLIVALAYGPAQGLAQSILGSDLASFAVLGGQEVTNVPTSTIVGNVGVSPGSSITGFGDATQVTGGTIQPGTQGLAQTQLTTAFNALFNTPFTSSLTGQDLGGLTLAPGVYNFSSTAQLTGALTLDGGGDANALWIFQIGSGLTTASFSSVTVTDAGAGAGLYWLVGSSATLGTDTSFLGNIVALTSISLTTRATIGCGRALARNGTVSMDMNNISIGCADIPGLGDTGGLGGGVITTGPGGVPVVTAVPEPEIYAMMAIGLGLMGFVARRRRQQAAAA